MYDKTNFLTGPTLTDMGNIADHVGVNVVIRESAELPGLVRIDVAGENHRRAAYIDYLERNRPALLLYEYTQRRYAFTRKLPFLKRGRR